MISTIEISKKAKNRYAENINQPLQCAGFYVNTALLERIALGYKIESVKLIDDFGNPDVNIYEIIHSKSVTDES